MRLSPQIIQTGYLTYITYLKAKMTERMYLLSFNYIILIEAKICNSKQLTDYANENIKASNDQTELSTSLHRGRYY